MKKFLFGLGDVSFAFMAACIAGIIGGKVFAVAITEVFFVTIFGETVTAYKMFFYGTNYMMGIVLSFGITFYLAVNWNMYSKRNVLLVQIKKGICASQASALRGPINISLSEEEDGRSLSYTPQVERTERTEF